MTPGLVVVAVLAGVLIAVIVGLRVRQRRHRAEANAIAARVFAEIDRDPALDRLDIGVTARTEWGGTLVELTGSVPSPWYRYATLRAVRRALGSTDIRPPVIDRLTVDRTRRGGARLSARRHVA
jgi:hypothetical protein